jgi:hypothetical protein
MTNGNLFLYDKKTNALITTLNIIGNFSYEDNLNGTPSNIKIKSTTTSTFREEFEVNTVAYHQDSDSWWVVKSDESTYLQDTTYLHETELVEYFEFLSYRHLVGKTFQIGQYTYKEVFESIIRVAKIGTIDIEFPTFLDVGTTNDKINKTYSFDGFTVANAIKTVASSINAIPKLKRVSGVPTLFFINRVGIDAPIKNGLDAEFPVAFEKNSNSSDQYLTRTISNLQNVQSSELTFSPKFGGHNLFTEGTFKVDKTQKTVIKLPTKIFDVKAIYFVPRVTLAYLDPLVDEIYNNYYFDIPFIKQKLIDFDFTGTSFASFNFNNTIFPSPEFLAIYRNDPLDGIGSFTKPDQSPFRYFFTIKTKEEYDLIEDLDEKSRTFYYEVGSDEIVVPTSVPPRTSIYGFTSAYSETILEQIGATPERVSLLWQPTGEDTLFRVLYNPISDIKVSYDNDSEAQDEKFFNQSGRTLDGKAVSRLILSHTNDSVEGTKLRQSKYTSFSNILPLGQLIRDNNQIYVVSQRSIDGQIQNGNEYYDVVYSLSKNRVARSENIQAESDVISYAVSSQALVRRVQLYKDYIELSLDALNNDTPYLSLSKLFNFDSSFVGADLNFVYFGKSTFTTGARYHIISPSVFDLSKSKIIVADYKDNNIVGYRLNKVSTDFIQTPVSYVDGAGQVLNLRSVFCNERDISNANQWYRDNYFISGTSDEDEFNALPFTFFPEITSSYSKYFDIALISNVDEDLDPKPVFNSIDINEALYRKDAFEIPVVEYQVQANDNFSPKGNIIVSDDIFKVFSGSVIYHFVPSTIRYTNENAFKLYKDGEPSGSDSKRVLFTRSGTNNEVFDFDLFNTLVGFPAGKNTTAFNNVGIFAKEGDNVKFLFAINDYTPSGINTYGDIRVFLNNWRI